MTPERLETLAMRVRDVQPNNPDAVGLSAWLPARAYLIGQDAAFNVLPVHGPERIVWRLQDRAGCIVRDAHTFAAAIDGVAL